MATDTGTGVDERHQYLCRMQKRYQEADRRQRSMPLDRMVSHTEMPRKAPIRGLSGDLGVPHCRQLESAFCAIRWILPVCGRATWGGAATMPGQGGRHHRDRGALLLQRSAPRVV